MVSLSYGDTHRCGPNIKIGAGIKAVNSPNILSPKLSSQDTPKVTVHQSLIDNQV
uniref:RecD-like DNA helicase n=1 Tax=Vibrio alginolyticus TaxID=663 RepID=A0A0N9DYW4_VIBAL|nr:RecD-like DNA helicase [Vibrio alginolyticus]